MSWLQLRRIQGRQPVRRPSYRQQWVFKNIIGLDDKPDPAEFTMNILGEYNIGGDAWEIDALLRKCGIHLTSTLSGDVSYEQVKKAHTVQPTASCATAPSITSPI